MSVTPTPLFYAAASPSCDTAPPLMHHGRRTPPPLPPTVWRHSPPDPPAFALPRLNVKGRRPFTATPFFSLSLTTLSPPGEACRGPYTSPCCLSSEPVTRASPKPSVDIVHPSLRSSRRRAAPVDLRCHLHFDKHRVGALLLLDLQVDASEPSSGRMPVRPSASTVPPPSKKRRRTAPSTTSSVPNPPW
jgi:hypothetical protein